jgi:NADPH:quinone reductase-like Zn-dependent oxidoreductase
MRAVVVPRYGKAEVLEIAQRPIPALKKGQVLVKNHASCVNPRDWLVREGKYVFKFALPPFPFIPGSDIAGEIASVGDGSSGFKVGDRVFGMQPLLGGMGAYAEYVAINAAALALIPANVSYQEAAAVPCAGLTAWQALCTIGQVKQGSRVVVNGASGGVGSYAIQIARAQGAHVIGITSTGNLDFIRSLGADEVIDYKTESYQKRLSGGGIDVFFDAIGRESLHKTAAIMVPAGRYISTIPNAQTFRQAVSTHLKRKLSGRPQQTLHLVLVRPLSEDLRRMADLMASGKMKSVIEQVFPLEQVRAAHDRSRTWHTRGKLVLAI